MSETSFAELPYIRNGEQIVFKFNDNNPVNITLTESILRDTGDAKYSISEMDYEVRPYAFSSRFNIQSPKEEAQTIIEQITVPSSNWGKSGGYYEFHITSREEAREIVGGHYPDAVKIAYRDDEVINYTNPPAPVEVYTFEVVADGGQFLCAVSKERGIFFTRQDGEWFAFTGGLEGGVTAQYMTLYDVRAIARKIGPDLTRLQ